MSDIAEEVKKAVKPPIGQKEQKEEDWLKCVDQLPDYVAHLPAGHIKPIFGTELWVDAYGKQMTRAEFILQHNIDPAAAWAAVKEYRKQFGGGVRRIKE